MVNDGTYFRRVGKLSKTAPKYYPPEVSPFSTGGIKFFAYSIKENEWRVIELRSGTEVATGTDFLEARTAAKSIVKKMGPSVMKNYINDTVKRIAAGYTYNPKTKVWNR